MCVFTFLVIDLVERIGMDYRLAGLALSAMQVGGVLSRLVWGYLSERWVPGRTLLIGIAIVGSLSLFGLASVEETWGFLPVAALCALGGITIAGWNGIFLAEVVKSLPREQLASAVATVVCFLYSGLVVGPAAFGGLVQLTGSYPVAYSGLGFAVAFAGILVWTTQDVTTRE